MVHFIIYIDTIYLSIEKRKRFNLKNIKIVLKTVLTHLYSLENNISIFN